MEKKPFVTMEQVQEMAGTYPTPFHLYDVKGIRDNAKGLKEAFAWNKGFRVYFCGKSDSKSIYFKYFKRLRLRNGLFFFNRADDVRCLWFPWS